MEESKINVNTEVDLVGVFVQNNQKFYKNKFDKMKESGKSISWNWAAFFMVFIGWYIEKCILKQVHFYY